MLRLLILSLLHFDKRFSFCKVLPFLASAASPFAVCSLTYLLQSEREDGMVQWWRQKCGCKEFTD